MKNENNESARPTGSADHNGGSEANRDRNTNSFNSNDNGNQNARDQGHDPGWPTDHVRIERAMRAMRARAYVDQETAVTKSRESDERRPKAQRPARATPASAPTVVTGPVVAEPVVSGTGDPLTAVPAAAPATAASRSEPATPGNEAETLRQAYEVIKAARDRHKRLNPLSTNTTRDYGRKSTLLRQKLSPKESLDPQSWLVLLAPYAGNAKSFRHHRAALVWAVREEISQSLKRQDAMQRLGNPGPDWLAEVERLQALIKLHDAVEAADREDDEVMHVAQSAPSRSHIGTRKREDLKTIRTAYPSWLSRFLLAMRRTLYLDAVRLMARVGCRPEELLNGVRIERVGQDKFKVRIKGAKVTANAGQAWREIEMPVRRLPRSWAKRLAKEPFFTIQIQSTAALKSAMRRASKRALPNVPAVTAYVLRHAMATAAREDGREAEDVAALLGHAVADTQQHYGQRRGGGRGGKSSRMKQATVSTARPVRPLDRSQLPKIAKGPTTRPPKPGGNKRKGG